MNNSGKSSNIWVVAFGVVNFLLLAGTLACIMWFWKPWESAITANTRKISITGTATVSSEPDQYLFSPSYTKDTTDEITKLNDQIIATLKNLGVTDSQIKNNASNYGSPEIYYLHPVNNKDQTTLSLTITLNDKKLAQKVQNYLLTTNPEGSITPSSSFSTAKQKELADKARGAAIKDARTKADETATGLGAKIGKVIEVSEGESSSGGGNCGTTGIICPVAMDDSTTSSKGSAPTTSLSVQPGTDEFTYNFTVVFALD